ncbi:hypothetical protein BUALT_Bualt12G0112900 [Buddleja alternifolia]|uniref:Pectinesterase inhibitor domain-containing protein n=1 Tax=Buddleja alternifolia TaxID=168488 RepID=A0AAV6X133_9LAMI|nr:hypothetical protein BUALT_Bualt12G0112900 [Buddleja alternifolia]
MEPHNILRLLFISLYVLISNGSSKSDLTPTAFPGPQPVSSHKQPTSGGLPPAPSLGPQVGPSSSITLPPTTSDAPSEAPISPNAHAPSPYARPSSDINPQVKKICDSTDFPDLCLKTVIPLLREKSNLESVLEITIKVGDELAKRALSLAKKLAHKPGTPPRLSSILKDCKDSYDMAVENYTKTINALSMKDIGTMETMLSAVITDLGDCQDGFEEEEGDSPFANFADKLTNITSNCLALVSLMK